MSCLYKSLFFFLNYLFVGLVNLISGHTSIDYIYSRFRVVVVEKIKNYNLDELDIEGIMRDVDDLQARFILRLEDLDMNENSKKKLLHFFKNWSNLFLRIELVKLKAALITENEFIRNVSAHISYRCNELEGMLMDTKEGAMDKETVRILELLQLVTLSMDFSQRFQSLKEIRDLLLNIINVFDSISDILPKFLYKHNSCEELSKLNKEERRCYT